ncbi:MAG: FkbM family methyltransferase [Conexivisphaerales archaeon]
MKDYINPEIKMNRTVYFRDIAARLLLKGVKVPLLEKELYFLREIVKPKQNAIDVGANVGIYSAYLSRLVGKYGLVFAFEPFFATFSHLIKNIGASENVKCFNIALGEKKGSIGLRLPQIRGGRINDPYVNVLPMQEGNVIMDTLDNFISEHNIDSLSFMKVDVEGYEYNVFRGAKYTLEKLRPIILTEIEERWAKRYGHTSIEVNDILVAHDYSCFFLKKKKLSPCESEMSKSGNYFYWPEEVSRPRN